MPCFQLSSRCHDGDMREGLRLVVFDNQRFLFHSSELKSIIDTIKLRTARERVGDRNEPIEEPISSGQMMLRKGVFAVPRLRWRRDEFADPEENRVLKLFY